MYEQPVRKMNKCEHIVLNGEENFTDTHLIPINGLRTASVGPTDVSVFSELFGDSDGIERSVGQGGLFSNVGSILTSGKRSPEILTDRAKQPRVLGDSAFSHSSFSPFSFSLHDLEQLEESLIGSESLDPTSPESGVDLSVDASSPPSVSAFTRTTMEGILAAQPPGAAAIQILEEPEQNYRPRYESEGHRAPMKGRRNKSSFPTVKIVNVPRHTTGTVQVSLVEVDSNDVFPFCQLSGGTVKPVGSSPDLVVKFSDLRIQRIINNEANRKTLKGKSNQGKLLFSAKLKTVDGDKVLQAYSVPILLEPAQGRGTLSAVVPSQGREGEDIVILGHKLAGPCVVEFSSCDDQDWTVVADLSKDKFQPAKNAILAKIPKLPHSCSRSGPVQVTVTVFTGRDRMESENTLQFTYLTCVEMAKPEVVGTQCALKLLTEGRDLLESQPYPGMYPDPTNGYPPPPAIQPPQQQQQPTSPQSDGWNDPVSANRIHTTTTSNADVFQFDSYSHQPIHQPKQLPATSSMQPFATNSSMQQPFPATSSMQQFSATSSMQQLPPSPPMSQFPVTSAMQRFPASPPMQTYPTTSSMQQLPASPTVQKCPAAASSMQPMAAMGHGPCSPFYPQSGFNSPRPL